MCMSLSYFATKVKLVCLESGARIQDLLTTQSVNRSGVGELKL